MNHTASNKAHINVSLLNTLDQLLGSCTDIILKCDENGTLLYANHAAEKASGLDRQKLLASNLFEPTDANKLFEGLSAGVAQIIVTKKASSYHLDVDYDAQNHMGLECNFSPELDANGTVRGVTVIARNITSVSDERRRLIRFAGHWHTMVKLSQKFITAKPSALQSTVQEALRTIGMLLGADRAYLFEYDHCNQRSSNTFEWCAPKIKPMIDDLKELPFSLFPEAIEKHMAGDPLIIRNVKSLNPKSKTSIMLQGQTIKSLVTMPIMSGERCAGFVGVDHVHETRDIKPEEIEVLQLFAGLVLNLSTKLGYEKKILRNEQYFKDIVQRAFVGIFLFRNHKIEFANNILCKMTGYSLQELQDPSCGLKNLNVDLKEAAGLAAKDILTDHTTPKSFSTEILTKKGEKKILFATVSAFTDESGPCTLGIVCDEEMAQQNSASFEELSKSLERRDKEFKDVLFTTAHNLHGPIANLDGLLRQLEIDKIQGDLNKRIVGGLGTSIHHLSETMVELFALVNSTKSNTHHG